MALQLLLPPSLGLPRAAARAELLEVLLTRRLDRTVRVEVARNYAELERRVLGADVDVAWAPPALCGRVEPGAHAILQAIRKGHATYRAALVGRADAGLSLETLAGKRAAWTDPLATAGYLLPRAHLRASGQDPDHVLAAQSFRGSYREALLAVVHGEADLAPSFAGDGSPDAVAAALAAQVGREARHLATVAITGEAPNDGLVITARPSAALARELVDRLLPAGSAPGLLLEVCDAEGLVIARPGAYAGFAVAAGLA